MSSTSQEPSSSSHQESWTVERGEFCEQVQTISSPILLTMTSQSATSASPHINEEADKSNDPPACSKCQEYFDTVVEKTVNEFAEEASCEINKEELSSLEQGRTMDQFGDEASFEINREELSSVEQEETIDQMGIEASCESHADTSDPALYIHM